MNLAKAITTLRRFNEWRRYNGPIGEGPEMPDPKEVGEAIDIATHILEELK